VITGPTPGSSADDVPHADPDSVARSILLRQLTMGPRTEAQLRQALQRRSVPEDVADAVVRRFIEVGLIDDASYAQEFVRSAGSAGTLSRRGVQYRLRQKGVSEDVVADAVGQIDPASERSAALDLALRRAARMAEVDPATRRRRLLGLLARRGYPSDIVHGVVDEVLAEAEALDADLP
jgi:regulatory protein